MKILLPQQPKPKPWFQDTVGFRELVWLWAQKGWVNLEVSASVKNCWLEASGRVLLFDRPILKHLTEDPDAIRASSGLFANLSVDLATKYVPNSGPWFFWPRHPRLLNLMIPDLKHKERDLLDIFIGNVHTSLQLQHRAPFQNLKGIASFFSLMSGRDHRFLPPDYYRMLARSKYGICLAGFGAKCFREIEYMALGVVPVCFPGVDLTGYFDPPVEGEHFYRVASVQEYIELRKWLSAEGSGRWRRMSENCRQWYDRNASIEGSFLTTMKALEALGKL